MSNDNPTTSVVPIISHGKGIFSKASQQLVMHTMIDHVYTAIGAQAPANLNARAIFEVKIPRSVDNLKKIWLEFTITNSDASAASVLPFFFIIDYINLKFGGQIYGPFPGDYLFQHYVLTTDINTLTVNQAVTNVSTAYAPYYATIAAGASVTVRIDISAMIESTHGLFIDGFTDDISIEFHTRPSAQFCSSAAPNISCSGWACVFGHERCDGDEHRQRKAAHRNGTFVYKTVQPIEYKANFTVTAGLTYSDTIKTILGYTNSMWVVLRPQGAQGSQLTQYIGLSNLYLKDDQTQIIGNNQWPGSFIKQEASEHFSNNPALNYLNIYPVIFAKSPMTTYMNGVVTGGFSFTGQSESIWFVPATGAGAADEILVYAFLHHRIIVDHGRVTIDRTV